MNRDPSLIDALFARYGVSGSWETLPSTGVANSVYATRDVVLRLATDHRDAVSDARTESVAAPIAFAAGILTPRLIAFDDTRVLVDRPFSLWERVHGQTLGLINPPPRQRAEIWRAVGRELAHLHLRVRECPDPRGWLDRPIREQDFATLLEQLVKSRRADDHTAQNVERLIGKLRPHLMKGVTTRFIHGDVHAMNVMCTPGGHWGDFLKHVLPGIDCSRSWTISGTLRSVPRTWKCFSNSYTREWARRELQANWTSTSD